jgi:CO/xanthine dehydrogenase Mo-binding subunit
MRRKRMRYGWNVHGFSQHPGWSRVTRLGVGLAAIGGISLVAGMLVAIVIADHSSSDSSPSSLIAIGLGSVGIILVVLGCAVLAAVGLGRLWRWASRTGHERMG